MSRETQKDFRIAVENGRQSEAASWATQIYIRKVNMIGRELIRASAKIVIFQTLAAGPWLIGLKNRG